LRAHRGKFAAAPIFRLQDSSIATCTWRIFPSPCLHYLFYECNLTKANFWHTYLLGFRLRGTDVTKVVFDDIPLIGLERKSRDQPISSDLQASLLGTLPVSAQEVELHHSGITMAGFNRTVAFLPSAEHAEPRTNIRVAETARYLRQAHADNGYDARMMHYYIIERRLRRHAMVGSFKARIRQALDCFFGEVIWRYGSSIIRLSQLLPYSLKLARSLRIWPRSGVRKLASARPDRQLFTDLAAGTLNRY
jgi:hypothetical protein